MNKKQTKEALDKIVDLKGKLNELNIRFSKSPLGDTGELYVWLELEKNGFKPTLKGGSSKVDITLANGKGIEVRSSLLKNEGIFKKGINFYGWRVQTATSTINFDYLICVAVDDDYSNPRFYLFTKQECERLRWIEKYPRFTSIKRKILLFENWNSYLKGRKQRPEIFSRIEYHLNKNPEKYQDKWDIIQD